MRERHDLDSASSLAAAAAGGDAAATAELLRSVWPDAFRVAWSIIGERTAAEDVAQEACARVLLSIATLRNPNSFPAWFYRIVVNESKARLRSAARTASMNEKTFVERGVAQEDRLDLQRAMRALDPPLRTVVVLRYYLGFNGVEIAKIVGASSMTVRWRLFIARRRLRRFLEARPSSQDSQMHRTGEYTDEPQAAR